MTLTEFKTWLDSERKLNGKSAEEWQKAYPNCGQAAFRSGMWYAAYEIEKQFLTVDIKENHL